jgi:hypothetical protein
MSLGGRVIEVLEPGALDTLFGLLVITFGNRTNIDAFAERESAMDTQVD